MDVREATIAEKQPGCPFPGQIVSLIHLTWVFRTNISRHRTEWEKGLAGSQKYRCGSRVPWFGQRKAPASDKFNHHLLAAVCGGSSQPLQKQQLLGAGTPRHYLARGMAMLA